MVMDFMEQQRMLEAKATELLREYEGKNLEEVGKHLADKSSYNHNYYMLPNGLEVVEKFDEFYEMGDIFGLIDGQAILIGHTYDDNIIHLGVVC
jgi:hypothetical protein